jgi:hypothetical protein
VGKFLLVMVPAMGVLALATIWLVKRLIQPPTAAGKKRLTIFLRFVVAQYVIITAFAFPSNTYCSPAYWGCSGLRIWSVVP